MLDPEKIITKLTFEEKILILSGYDAWYTHKIERLNIPSLKMSDGPKVSEVTENKLIPCAVLSLLV